MSIQFNLLNRSTQLFVVPRRLIFLLTLCLTFIWQPSQAQEQATPPLAESMSQTTQNQNQNQSPKININQASAEEIANALKGVGLHKAQAIVAYRQANGNFVSIDELKAVKGIGPAILAKNADAISLN